MLAKKFGLFGSRESEVFSYFASDVRVSKKYNAFTKHKTIRDKLLQLTGPGVFALTCS